jgi:hypothetical protein
LLIVGVCGALAERWPRKRRRYGPKPNVGHRYKGKSKLVKASNTQSHQKKKPNVGLA